MQVFGVRSIRRCVDCRRHVMDTMQPQRMKLWRRMPDKCTDDMRNLALCSKTIQRLQHKNSCSQNDSHQNDLQHRNDCPQTYLLPPCPYIPCPYILRRVHTNSSSCNHTLILPPSPLRSSVFIFSSASYSTFACAAGAGLLTSVPYMLVTTCNLFAMICSLPTSFCNVCSTTNARIL